MYTYLIGMPERIRKRDKILLNRIFTLFSRLHSEYDFRSLPMERPAPFSNHSLPAASTKSACGSLFKTHQCFNRERATLTRSEEHTSELQSRENLVCRLLLEKKKT